MEISNNFSSKVNFKSQTQSQTSPIDVVKNKIESLDDKEKITVGLSALGILALAGIAIAKRPHKAKQVVEELTSEKPVQQVTQAVSEVVQDVKPKFIPKTDLGHLSKQEQINQSVQQGVERAIDATKEYVQGGNYSKIRSEATKNLSHEGKEVVKRTLEKAHSAQVAQNEAVKHVLSANAVEATQNAKVAKNVRQGLKNAANIDDIAKKIDIANNAAEAAQQSALEAKELAGQIGTKKAKNAATRAQNGALNAQKEAAKTEFKAIEKAGELGRQQAIKEQNIEKLTQSPNYEDGLIKQMYNADNQAKTRLKNLIKKKTQHGKMTEKQALEVIAGNTKETELTRKLALERLQKL